MSTRLHSIFWIDWRKPFREFRSSRYDRWHGIRRELFSQIYLLYFVDFRHLHDDQFEHAQGK